jgi:hypothetical protein
MNNFDTDFLHLLEMNERIKNEKEAVVNLEDELKSQCSNFLNKHSIQNKLGRLGSIESLLDRRLSAKQLLEFIERSDRNEWGLFSKLPPYIKDHIRGVKLDNEILNYNTDVITRLEHKYKTWDSLDDENLNNLFVTPDYEDYFIDRVTEYLLKGGFELEYKSREVKKHAEGYVNLVVFNTIKLRDEKVLVYNYITYPMGLFKLLYLYAILEQKFCLCRGKKGYVASDFYFVLDKSLRIPELEPLDAKVNKAYPGFFSPDKDYLDILDSEASNYITLFKWVSYGRIMDINFEELEDLELIKDLIGFEFAKILRKLNKDIQVEQIRQFVKELKGENIYNILSRFIFLVEDLDKMTYYIENKLKLKVNQGPQKFRGQCSYISHILFSIDKAFRNSMYNHNRIFLKAGGALYERKKHDRYIPKGCFSFKNIHINLGKVRW